ncbi:zinc finger CCCH domain-containing protein 15 homolog [Bacillus rossius redtenbacheri]|uniref:zinc finger CCCH domain-containing protein 15 homolog n=1 Tax=Bacillus rossius redtenbacheri TaxID=93214 RepID=UPI002FDE544C
MKMPPKVKPAQPSKKTIEKKKEKVIEDKTFGLKNKKGAKQQRFIQQVQHQVKTGGPGAKKTEDVKKLEKEKKLLEQKEMNLLFRPVATQKIEKGADPKSVLCAFFKQGQCSKGDRCKFSHDLTLERKAEKRSLYVDMRDDGEDTMENWDEQKLMEVVEKKHGEAERKMPPTEIICKFFLDAVEKSKYGWFWSCPNGSNCIYRHALPPGFMLKKDRKKEEKKDEISLEDLIERERAALGSVLTKITLETFTGWKKRKLKEKKDAALREEERKRSDYKAGKQMGFSGREMFFFNPELAAADQFEEGDEAFDSYNLQDDDDDDQISYEYREIQLDALALEAQEVDGTGTQAPADRLIPPPVDHSKTNGEPQPPGDGADEAIAVPINENLFVDDDDLEDLEEGLDDLDIDH